MGLVSLPEEEQPPETSSASSHSEKATGGPSEKVTICKPGGEFSPETNQDGSLKLASQPPAR